MMKLIKLELFQRIPKDGTCKFESGLCRFCVKTKTNYTCALHNIPLMSNGISVLQAPDCNKALKTGRVKVESKFTDTMSPEIYTMYEDLRKAGVSEKMALKETINYLQEGPSADDDFNDDGPSYPKASEAYLVLVSIIILLGIALVIACMSK